MTTAIGVAVWLLTLGPAALSHEAGEVCKGLTYENRNQTDYGPLRVPVIRGIATDAQGVAVPKVCLGIFTEPDHKLISSTETDNVGRFEFKDISKGNYRLVAKYDGFSPANAKLRVETHSQNKKPLTVQMRFAGLDTTSFVELK